MDLRGFASMLNFVECARAHNDDSKNFKMI
jgi:hypothetical protein